MSKVTERRKLLQEMERVFKLTKEGLDEFDVKFKEAKQAPTKQMKEKFTDELAKKLTKLKRFRENVIVWSNHRDVKDRTIELEEMRLDIEIRMEAYRAMEKEDKIKPFSERALEMEPKIDPKEKERDDIIGWLRTTIHDLNQQCEPWEAELEKFGSSASNASAAPKRGRDRPRLSYHQTEKIDTLTKRMEQNHNHVAKLELILRALYNDCLSIDDLQRLNLRKRVQKFVDAQQACKSSLLIDDSLNLYDEILEMVDNFDTNLLITSPTSGDHKENEPSLVNSVNMVGNEKVSDNPSSGEPLSSIGSHYEAETKRKIKHEASAVGKGSKFFATIRRRQSAPSALLPCPPAVVSSVMHASPKMLPPENYHPPAMTTTTTAIVDQPRQQVLQYSTVAASGVRQTVPLSTVNTPKVEQMDESDCHAMELSSEISLVDFSQDSFKHNESPICFLLESDQDFLPWCSSWNNRPSSNDLISFNQQDGVEASSTKSPTDDISNEFGGEENVCEGFVDSLLALNPLGMAPYTNEHENILQCLEKSFNQILDDPATCAVNRTMHSGFHARAVLNSRSYYPAQPLSWMCYQDFYEELKNDTLVWIFYYMERTSAQRGAIAALQKRGWMWHTRDRRWYCRIGERAIVTEDYEEGIECYSCMSDIYKSKWSHHYSLIYHQPTTVSVFCHRPKASPSPIGVVNCSAYCVSMVEQNVSKGIVTSSFIRGCSDRFAVWGLNMRKFTQKDKERRDCRTLLMNEFLVKPGDLHLAPTTQQTYACLCRSHKCNDSPLVSKAFNNYNQLIDIRLLSSCPLLYLHSIIIFIGQWILCFILSI